MADKDLERLKAVTADLLKDCNESYPLMCRSYSENQEGMINRVVEHAINRNISIQKAIAELEALFTKDIDMI